MTRVNAGDDILWVIISNPENRRSDYFLQALASYSETNASVISYLEILCDYSAVQKNLSELIKNSKAKKLIVRIDSPGENFEVEKNLIATGALMNENRIQADQAKKLNFDKGLIHYTKEWYRGFEKTLLKIQYLFERICLHNHKELHFINTPKDIVRVFDKKKCQHYLSENKIPVASIIPEVDSYETLLYRMQAEKTYRVFIKLKHGSSASGVVALQINPRTKKVLIDTSVEIVKTMQGLKFYNSLKVRRYTDTESIIFILNFLFDEGAYVEKWIPKPNIRGKSYDFRILVTHQKATHYVVRKSHSPMTNLHLGNERSELVDIPDGEQQLLCVQQQAVRAAKLFPRMHSIGIDVISSIEEHKTKILELNAFGDLLPGVNFQGLNSYEWLVQSSLSSFSSNRHEDYLC